MGEGGDRDPLTIVGETPNLAARLQGLAEPDAVLISATTHRLVQGFFECHDLGTPTLQGMSTSLRVYQVLNESDARSRLEVIALKGLTPLVGREEQLTVLLDRWEQVKKGTGHVLLLSGEAGIGKSRLVQALREQAATDPHTWLECHCSPYHQNSPLYPAIDLLWRGLRFRRGDAPQARLERLERALIRYGLPAEDTLPLFASLLSLPLLASRYTLPVLTPQHQRQKTLEALLAWLGKATEQGPVIGVVEDLQWADPSTLESLSLFIEQVPTARLLIILTFRPEFHPSWEIGAHLSQMTLPRLSPTLTQTMIMQMVRGKVLPTEITHQLVSKTDGVPLFVEELTKTVLESGLLREGEQRFELTGELRPLAIPTTLHDSLMARLDRLTTAKEIAQLGATLGREFSYELIRAVSPLDEGGLQKGLASLVDAELLYQKGQPPQARYLFKHALVQETAYQSLLKSRRQQYHQHIARVLEERFLETVEIQPELLAHHYTEAGLRAQAIPYWQRAGERAVARSANLEAVDHLAKALELLSSLPDAAERAQQELLLQTMLGPALSATKGYSAPDVERTYARARELCMRVGETPQLFPVLWGLWAFYHAKAKLQTARDLGEQLIRLAQSVQDPDLLVEAHGALAQTLYLCGELTAAREHVERCLALYDPKKHHTHAFVYGEDPGVVCRGLSAWILWLLGYPDQARQRMQQTLALAQELAHPFSSAQTFSIAAVFHHLCQEAPDTQEQAEAAIALSTEQDFPYWLATGPIFRGWAATVQGQRGGVLAEMHQGLATVRQIGTEMMCPYFLALLAETCGRAGQVEEGVNLLAEALAMVNDNGECWYEAELWRLKGQLVLQSGVRSPKSQKENRKSKGKRRKDRDRE
jgi:predicted ATPase